MTPGQRHAAIFLGLGAVLLAGTHALDPWAMTALALPAANDRDWGRLLRVVGFAPTWLVVAAALWLEAGLGGPRGAPWRATALAIVIAVAVSGLGAEAIKLIVRRERPDPEVAGYAFRPFGIDPWSTSRLGFPSSHAAVAFAGVAALAYRFRRAAPLLFALALGCGLTRIFARAHFLSDVAGAALVGTCAGWLIASRLDRAPERAA